VSRNGGVTQPSAKQGYVKRKRVIASLDSTNERVQVGGGTHNKMSSPNHHQNSRDIFTNDMGVKFTMNGSKTCQGGAATGLSGKKS